MLFLVNLKANPAFLFSHLLREASVGLCLFMWSSLKSSNGVIIVLKLFKYTVLKFYLSFVSFRDVPWELYLLAILVL